MIVKGSNRLTENINSILLVQLGDIGDVILTLPCIRALRETYPKAKIQVAVRDKAEGLIKDCFWVDGVISITKKRRGVLSSIKQQVKFVKELRGYRFDLAIDLRTGTRGAIMAFLSGARDRVGFLADDEPPWRNWLFTALIDHSYRPGQYVADHLLDLLAVFGITPSSNVPEYAVSDERLKQARALLLAEGISCKQPIIAVQPFSLWSYKELPEATMVSLLKNIQQNHQANIIIIGSPAERQKAESLVKLLNNKIHNLAGKTSISSLPALLKSCSNFIGIDSAGLHIAAAVGTKTVAIFGPSSPESWAPRGDEHLVVQSGLSCIPCREKGCNNTEASRCLLDLDSEDIYKKIKPVIVDFNNDKQ